MGCRFAPRCPYARERCHEEEPPLTPAGRPDHVYACWYPVGSPEFQERDEQLAANLRAEQEALAAAAVTGPEVPAVDA
jgi:peptide/nickel transport system ATP-binding protein